MLFSIPKKSFQEKISALKQSLLAVYLSVFSLSLLALILPAYNFILPLPTLFLLFALALIISFMVHFCLTRGWLISPLYHFLYSFPITLIVIAGIFLSGSFISPFVWIGLLVCVFDVIAYYPLKGFAEAILYVLALWILSLGNLYKILPYFPMIPNLDILLDNSRFVYLTLFGHTLLFFIIPFGTGLLSIQLREEKEKATAMLEKQTQLNRENISIMEKLKASQEELNQKIKDLEDSRRAILHVLSEVTNAREEAQKKAEEISKLYEELKVLDRMKSEFLSVISHELRTPLTPILGYLSLFLNEQFGSLSPEYKKAAAILKKESTHLLSLIESILDVSRMEQGKVLILKKEPVSLSFLLKEIQEVFNFELEERGIKLYLALPPNFPTLIADANKLRRLFTNLIGNALKFTPRGGWIKVSADCADNFIRVEVADNGIGIAQENLEKIFNKFYQVDSSYTRLAGGLGLGLTIAKEIVEAHGGKIWAESEGLGKGSKIIFTLPLSTS